MLEHGGNLAAAAKLYGIPLENWLDLSTGLNPNGYPISDISAAVWQKLPLADDGLVEAACAYYGSQFVLPTAGSHGSKIISFGIFSRSRLSWKLFRGLPSGDSSCFWNSRPL